MASPRPDNFTLNMNASLANGLVFAGLGRAPGSTRYHDSSAFGNHGTLTNMDVTSCWVWQPELNRFAINFDGSNDWINCGGAVIASYPYSLCAWMKPTAGYESTAISVSVKDADTSYVFIRWNNGGGGYNLSRRNGGEPADATGGTLSGNWDSVIAVARTSTNVELYVNGISVATNTTDISVAVFDKTSIGVLYRSGNPATNPMNGKICDPLIYRRALVAAEISQLADPSNVMLSGLIVPPRRKYYGTTVPAAAASAGWFPIHTRRGRVISAA